MNEVVDYLAEFIDNVLVKILNLLPSSPFRYVSVTSEVYKILTWVNWVVPLDFMLSTMEGWLVAISVYYVWSLVLRWIKAID